MLYTGEMGIMTPREKIEVWGEADVKTFFFLLSRAFRNVDGEPRNILKTDHQNSVNATYLNSDYQYLHKHCTTFALLYFRWYSRKKKKE